MLVTLKEILEIAEKGNFAAGAFNTPNLECLLAVNRLAAEFQQPFGFQNLTLLESGGRYNM